MSSAQSPAGPPAKGAKDLADSDSGGGGEVVRPVAQQPLVGKALQQRDHVLLDDLRAARHIGSRAAHRDVGDAANAVDEPQHGERNRVDLIGALGRENDRTAARAVFMQPGDSA